MKTDHPRAIDRYIDFFGEGTGTGSAAPDTWTMAMSDSPSVEHSDLAARDDQPRL
jgi:hypothetical protein